MYTGRGNEDDVKNVLATYRKGQIASVKGFVSQKSFDVEKDGKTMQQYKNTYYITSFLTSETEFDFDKMTDM